MSGHARAQLLSSRGFCFLVALLLGVTFAGASQAEVRTAQMPESEQAVISQAENLLNAGNLPAALHLLYARLECHPKEVPPRILLAAVYEASHNFKAAETELQFALKCAPDDSQVLTRLGSLYDQLGHPGKAEPLLARAAELVPSSGQTRLAWATTLAELHRYPEAAAALRGVQPPDRPKQSIAYLRLRASVALGLGDAKTAARDMEAALRLAPQNHNLLLATAVAELQAGRNQEAAQEFSHAATLAPGNSELYYDLALAQFRAGQLDAALANARHAQSFNDSASVESLIGDVEETRGDSLDAVHRYQKALTLEPQKKQYWLTLSLELMRHETYKPALIVLKEAAQRFPGSLRVQLALGLDQYFLEHYPQAIQALLSATRRAPESPLPVDYLGEIQLQPPVTPQPAAIRAVCRYADDHPRRGEAMAYCGALLARVEHDAGRKSPSPEALRRLQQAARLAPASAIARCELGKALQWAGEWRTARTQMEACLRLNPHSAEADYRLARIYLHLGETTLAKKAMKHHDAAVQSMVAANARHDAEMKKFLYTLVQSSRSKP